MTATKREATVSWVSGSDNSAPILKFVVEFANINVDPNTWFPVSLKKSGTKGSEKVVSVSVYKEKSPDGSLRSERGW